MRRDYGKVFDIPFNSKNKYQVHVHCESQDPESTPRHDDNDRVPDYLHEGRAGADH